MPSSASPPTGTSPLSLHDALPIWLARRARVRVDRPADPHDRLLQPLVELGRDALRRGPRRLGLPQEHHGHGGGARRHLDRRRDPDRSEEHTSELQSRQYLVCRLLLRRPPVPPLFPYTTLFRSGSLGGLAFGSTVLLIPMIAFFNLWSNWGATLYGEVRGASDFRKNIMAMAGALVVTSIGAVILIDRKSTRLNSSHANISYAVFCFAAHRYLPSFPTRRSSDLARSAGSRSGRPSC